ncbi:cell division control protein 42 homolog [Agrilus planipennis]|uniref:Cell division control protein 42 homolog n=1 Tax=Agrilus planipennis TaxID=224129 RepID=A0A1W4WTW9_AGRPL|nr:cell division control protein 42 homolog [Agrilus planipennis]
MNYTKQPLLKEQPLPVKIFKRKRVKVEKDKKCKIKCVLVGDKAVGKTSLAVSYSNDTFPSEYVPTAYDNYNVVVQVDGEPIRVELCDTAGQDEFTPLRSLCYPGTDVFMLCFSLVKPYSFHSACTRWAEELSKHEAAVVLVGTQADLLNNPDVLQQLREKRESPVSKEHALNLAARLNAPYIATSAKTCNHLKAAFDQAIILALKRQRIKNSFWRRLCCV